MKEPVDHTPRQIVLYTDGGCRGNPGPGAWAAVSFLGPPHAKGGGQAEQQGRVWEISGAAAQTTNNRMELQAVIEGFKALRQQYRQCFETGGKLQVAVYTDSQYVRNGITAWIRNWKKNGWRTSSKQPVKNLQLWQELDHLAGELAQQAELQWHWVKGHAGNRYNERCDQLVQQNFPT